MALVGDSVQSMTIAGAKDSTIEIVKAGNGTLVVTVSENTSYNVVLCRTARLLDRTSLLLSNLPPVPHPVPSTSSSI